jgi:hypothetical protein
MEYVHGANLREILRAHAKRTRASVTAAAPAPAAPTGRSGSGPQAVLAAPLPLPQALGIVAAAAAGLHYAHDRLGPGGEPLGIVHRDVSPSNVLVSYDGAIKVSDFGIAKWALQRTRTQEGTLKGKFAYMSPEQCRGRPVDRRSDVFALGTILYELTTGSAPFSAPNDLDILNQIATGTAAPPVWPESAGKYPAALSAIVMRALEPDPDRRFPSMQALQMALESFGRDAGLSVSTVEIGTFMQELFAPEIEAWKAAQREGKSLGEHLAARPAAPAQPDAEERTATDGFATTNQRALKRSRWRQRAATAAFVAVSAFAGGMVVKVWRGDLARSAPAPASPSTQAAAPPPSPGARPAPDPLPALPVDEKKPAAAPGVADSPPTTKAKLRGRARTATTPAATAKPTQEARLGAWDPDSPVPPQ